MAQSLEMVHGSKTLHAGERGDGTPGCSVECLPAADTWEDSNED